MDFNLFCALENFFLIKTNVTKRQRLILCRQRSQHSIYAGNTTNVDNTKFMLATYK